MSPQTQTDLVSVQIDGQSIEVEKGTLIIRAAEKLGIHIPRFCDHPLLDPVGACRQCLVEVAMPDRSGEVRPMPKPQPACTMTCTPGMEVKTAQTSEVAKKAQHGVTEFLLINHPLDCPICDKGGECPLQNQSMSHGTLHTRFQDVKRVWPKPVELTSQILLDRDRCVLCQRCVRFSKQIAGDAFIALQGRGGGSSARDHHFFMGENIGAFDRGILDFSPRPESAGAGNTLPANVDALTGQAADTVAGHGLGDYQLSDSFGKPAPVGDPTLVGASVDELDMSGRLFSSYFSGNIIQICPVGALTSKQYRFRSRPFDLVSTRGITEQDASGAAIRTDIRRGQVTRRLAQRDMAVNEEWITDKDRFAYAWQFGDRRLHTPLVRSEGKLVATSWSDALGQAADALAKVKGEQVGFLPGGRLTFEDAYAWSKFARSIVGSNHIDQRSRPVGSDEESFLGAFVAGTGMPVTYQDLEQAGQVLLVGFEPEDECGAIFLRLRKAVRAGKLKVTTVAPFATPSSIKTNAEVLTAAPGTEPEVVNAISADMGGAFTSTFEGLQNENAVILVGERAALTPGLLAAVTNLSARTAARLAWVPRRSGERGGVEAGLLPGLLPFGRPVSDQNARAEVGNIWQAELPSTPGLNSAEILAATVQKELKVLVVGGTDLRDFADPVAAKAALQAADFVISLEVNQTEISELADVVLPVAGVSEKPGTFINWEGRLRPFGQALVSHQLSDRDILDRLAHEMGYELGLGTLKAVHQEANDLVEYQGVRFEYQPAAALGPVAPGAQEVVVSTHKPMVDDGLMLAGADDLKASARRPFIRISPETAAEFGLLAGDRVRLSNEHGAIELPIAVTAMPQRVVWIPECSPDSHLRQTLRVGAGALVTLELAQAKVEVNR